MELNGTEKSILRDFFLFKNLPDEEFERLRERLEIKSFSRGEIIYSRRCFERALAIVLGGEVSVCKESGTLLNLIRPGGCFGAAALFAPAEEYVTTVSASRAAKLALLPAESFRALLQEFPGMAMEYIEFLSGRIQFLNKKIDSFTSENAADALMRYLESRADGEGRILVSEGYSRLARELNIGRASLYRALTELSEQNKIIKDGAEIILCGR